MTVVGNVFVRVLPESAGFVGALEGQLKGGLGFVGAHIGAEVAVAAISGLAKIGEEFEKARHQIEQETGATGKTLAGLAGTVTEAFKGVPVSLGAAATAVDQLFREGVPLGPQLEQLAKQELFLAKITKEDLAANVESTTRLMQKFNVPVADQARELDVLFKAYQASGQSFSVLTQGLQTAGGVLQSFGFSLDKSAALLATLERAGVNLGPALAGLRLAFGKITAEGGDPQKRLAALLAEFTDGTPKTKALADAIQLFGKRSGAELSIAISKGKFDVDALLKSITDGKGGIVATGLSTLTLGDQFKLLRNDVEASLSGIGTAVLHAFEDLFANAAGPVEHLVSAFAHLATVIAPTAVVFAPLIEALRLIAPVVEIVATGVDTIASALGHLPAPATAALVLLVGLRVAGQAIAFALSEAAAAAVRFGIAFAVANPEIAIAIAAIAAIGLATKAFSDRNAEMNEEAKKLGAAFAEIGKQASEGATHVASATATTKTFLETISQSDGPASLKQILAETGTTTATLTSLLGRGGAAFDRYKEAATTAAEGPNRFGKSQLELRAQFGFVNVELDKQRAVIIKAAQAQLDAAFQTGNLTAAQKRLIETQFHLKDSTADALGAIDALNVRLAASVAHHDAVVQAADSTQRAEANLTQRFATGAITADELKAAFEKLGLKGAELSKQIQIATDKAAALNQAHDALVNRTITTTVAYQNLARGIATGNVTQAEAERQLRALGLSAEGAKQGFSDLSGQVKAFVDGALSQLPTVSTAVSAFTQAISSTQSTLDSDLKQRQSLAEQLNKTLVSSGQKTRDQLADINLSIAQDQADIAIGSTFTTDKLDKDLQNRSQIIAGSGKASADVRAEIAKNNAAITADYAKLAADKDPTRFTEQLIKNTLTIAAFTQNLGKLIHEGFGSLAGELAKLGPEAAGGLAQSLADSPSKAKIASKAADLAGVAKDTFKSFLEKNFPELQLGAPARAAGLAVGKVIADGIILRIGERIPELRGLGVAVGGAVHEGAQAGVDQSGVSEKILERTRVHIPEFRGLGVTIGTEVNAGATQGAGQATFTTGLLAQLGAKGEQFRLAGVALGGAVDEGIAAGIILGRDTIGNAVVIMTDGVVKHVESQWLVKSPSKVFSDIGEQVGAGLAQGITLSAGGVTAAAVTLTGQVTSALRVAAPPPIPVGFTVSPLPDLPQPAPLTAHVGYTVAPTPALPVLSPLTVGVAFAEPQLPALPDAVTIPGRVSFSADPLPPLPDVAPLTARIAYAVPGPPVLPDPAPLTATVGYTVPPLPALPAPAPVDATIRFTQPAAPSLPDLSVVAPVSYAVPPLPTLPTPPPIPVAFSVPPVPAFPALGPLVAPVSFSVPGPPDLPPIAGPPPVPINFSVGSLPTLPSSTQLAPLGAKLGSEFASEVATSASAGVRKTLALPAGFGSNLVGGLLDAFNRLTGPESLANFVNFASGVVSNFHKAFEDITIDAGSLQKVLDELSSRHTTVADKLSSDLVNRLLGSGLLRTKVAAPDLSSPIEIARAKQSLPVPSPQDRADAQRQLQQARGIFDGAKFEFNEKADPKHIAAEIAWALK